MKYILILFVLFTSTIAHTQIISTVVGGGSSTVDSSLGILSQINNPGQLAFDKEGNLYFPQILSNTVSKLNVSQYLINYAGTGIFGYSGDGGPALNSKLNKPNTVAVSKNGNVYVCDNNNSVIRMIRKNDGVIVTIAGNGLAGFSGDGGQATNASLFYPAGICLDKNENLLISDGSRRLRRVDKSGIINTIAGIGLPGVSGDGGLAIHARCGAGSICVDAVGNIYIANCSVDESRIAKIDTNGIITTFAGTNSNYTFNGDNIPATSANINPVGIVVDVNNNVYFADWVNHRVRRIDRYGIITTVCGNGVGNYSGDGGQASEASLNMPQGVALDSCGNLYISDNVNKRIRKVTFNPECLPLNVTDANSEVKEVKVYPNPVLNELNVRSEEAIQEVALYNAVGQLVLHGAGGGQRSARLAVGQLPAGVYMVRVNGQYVNRIVKQ
jgi:sugar lactone lactonase YvrE